LNGLETLLLVGAVKSDIIRPTPDVAAVLSLSKELKEKD
jgi:hypothetical protein